LHDFAPLSNKSFDFMKVQSPADEFNPLRAVSSGSDLARSSANAELHYGSPSVISDFYFSIVQLEKPQ
jgi:hypothetical protein